MIHEAIVAVLLITGGYGGYKIITSYRDEQEAREAVSSVKKLNGLMQAHGNGSPAVEKVNNLIKDLPK